MLNVQWIGIDSCTPSSYGHDKSLQIQPYANLPDGERPILFYAGDGVSDLSAARETDLLFAKEGRGMHEDSYLVLEPMLTVEFRSGHLLPKRECSIHDISRLL